MRALALARKNIFRHRAVNLRRLRYAREKSSRADKPNLEALTKTVNQLHAEVISSSCFWPTTSSSLQQFDRITFLMFRKSRNFSL